METTIESQNKRIRKHLESGKSLTPLDALYKFGSFRLGARIHWLKKHGMKIKCDMIEITSEGKIKKIAKYSMM